MTKTWSEIENMEKLMDDKGVQFRDFQVEVEQREGGDDEPDELVIRGVPIVFDTETVLWDTPTWMAKEIIDRSALDDADMSDVIFNYNHCGRVYARTRNDTLQLAIEEDGVHMEAHLWGDDPGHRELYRDIKRGSIDKMSFAFTVRGNDYDTREEDGKTIDTRTITQIDRVFDVSAVDIPAYDATSISARRAFDAESEKREAERAKAESKARDRKRRHRLAMKLKLKNMEVK